MPRYFFIPIFLTVWSLHAECNYDDRAKIRTSDGNIYLEPARGRNIYLSTYGPQSTVFIGDTNLINVTSGRSGPSQAQIYELNTLSEASNDVLRRLQALESLNLVSHDQFIANVSALSLRLSRISSRLSRLQREIEGWTGDNCQLHTCQNGGTCLDLIGDFHCLCPFNWEGRNCEIDVNECRNLAGTDLGCQNNADCINKPGTYECQCKSGWYGTHCTRRKMDCAAGNFEMCRHGTCVPVSSGDGIKCICDQGWTTNGSVACLTDVNECDTSLGSRCSTNPKVECINLPGSFRCGQCPPGFHGDGYVCYDIDECATSNGGCSSMVSCHNTIGSRICGTCPSGYIGDGVTCTWRGSCSIDHGGCHSSARCVDNSGVAGAVQCVCPQGMDGDGVGIHGCYVSTNNSTSSCENNPCGPNGRCHKLRDGYTCVCIRGFSGAHCDVREKKCAINPCKNGGLCRPDSTTPLGFRCECTTQYTGTLCQERSRCGSILRAEEGSLVYPLSNTTFEYISKCAWIIRTVPEKVINVTFSRFDLERSPECNFVFLQIHDGRSTADPLLGRFCGSDPPMGGHILSSQHNLYLWFLSNTAGNHHGFALHWTSTMPICGGEINATVHGAISSPGSPGNYPPNRDCYWHLRTTLGKRIQLHFFQLDIESHNNCSFDYLSIYDGYQTTDHLLEKYCSATQPAPLLSSSSEMLIHFHSDAHSSGNGFQITYAPVEGIPGCGGVFGGDRGEVSSPSYDGSYLNNLMCEYKIRTGQGTQIQLDFKMFKLERSRNCKRDYLKIYDGSSSESPVMGIFCGELDRMLRLNSSSNSIFMVFRSDRSRGGEGFKIGYNVICNYFVRGDSGFIKSPGYPFTYPDNRVCNYVIETTPSKAIELYFQDFDIEGDADCNFDNVEIRDGLNGNSPLLGKYCGNNIPPTQRSTYNIMHVRFNSDMSQSGGGFYANFTTIDIECGGIHKEPTATITHPSGGDKYQSKQKCSWIILAPAGKYIKLIWSRFDIETTRSCTADYLELSILDNNSNTLRKLCGNILPPSMTIATNNVMLQFVSDPSVQGSGFSVTYTFVDAKGYCGGNLLHNHGTIYSPGWPNRYAMNLDCIWTISVPTGQQIKLNISHFHLEEVNYRTRKCDDFLRVTNGPSPSSPLIGEYCGKFNWKSVTSTANTIFLHFHSDFLLSGKGFKIEWDSTVTGCGGTFTGYRGFISSPNYPQKYEENSECFYRIVINQGSRISFKFSDFELETNELCDDYVEIFDGRDPESRSLGKFCGMPTEQVIETTGSYAFIKFKSDFILGGKGFLLSYNAICNNTLTGYYGVIESLDYPNSYPVNINCTWTISVPKGSKINVTFTNFDIRSKSLWYWERDDSRISRRRNRNITCNVDYLLIGEPAHGGNTCRYCGSNIPAQISAASNLLNISFFTKEIDAPQEHTGFRLEWFSYGCRGHIKKVRGYFNKTLSSSDVMECEWLIEVPIGRSIRFTIAKIYMMYTSSCTTDSIEIYNGPTKDSPLLTKLCHVSDVTTVTSTSNYLLVRLIKNSSLKDVHLAASFSGTQLSCGGYLQVHSGVLTSKNYPRNYDNNLDCTWIIKVPLGHRVALEFGEIDLRNENNDCQDSIQLYDTINILTNNYTHIICDKLSTKYYISKSNVLVVRFVSNAVDTARGFKASFAMTCGGVISLTEKNENGIITNDNFKSHSNFTCLWTILAANLEEKVSLIVTHLSLPIANDHITNKTCPNSYLRILDGNDENAPLIGEFCGHKIPATIVSRGSSLTVVLGTNDEKICGVFSAYYTTVDIACGGTLTSESGLIASPGYPAPYPTDAVCEWTLKTSPGNSVSINIDMLDIGYSEECNEDYLEVRENDGAGRILGIYCGSVVPMNTTSASKLYIKFRSDNKNNGRGFLIHYSFVHGNNIMNMNSGEISSPLYPRLYDSSGDFWWRITGSGGSQAIVIQVDKLQIDTHSEFCDDDNLSIYDGHDDEAPLLKKLCGALHGAAEVIRTTSNAAYIKLAVNEQNTGALFHLRWSQGDRDIVQTIDNPNCGNNETVTVRPPLMVETFSSPNYPNHYENEQNCEWIFKAIPGQHLSLRFIDFNIEEREPCTNGDFVSIYKSDVPAEWKPIKENMCLKIDAQKIFSASTYMKIIFRSDSSYIKKGFSAVVKSLCGSNLTEPSGFIESTSIIFVGVRNRCDWKVTVRPGRRIKLEFVNFSIVNKENDCQTYIVLHNGESRESPKLSDGKYCGYPHENRSTMVTSGNNLFVSYIPGEYLPTQRFKLHYEEIQATCGGTSKLNSDHAWEIISTPNYPNVPDPYTECNWLFIGPIGEILRVDFIERFDVHKEQDCISEYVEIHDGSSEFSPTKGHFCDKNPGTTKSSGNSVFIQYVTDRAEPNNGFKANISIDVCGGIISTSEGEVTSPGYPNTMHLLPGTVCEWHIIGLESHIISIVPQEMILPESESYCATKVTIEEFDTVNNTYEILKSYCTQEEDIVDQSAVETSGNSAKIKLHIGAPSEYNWGESHTGFRFTFKSTKATCRERFTISEGYITTPSYPRDSKTTFCHWSIRVPDHNRRVTLEILDSSKLTIFITEGYERNIKLGYEVYYDISSYNTTYKSSGNTMDIRISRHAVGSFKFKARFTSYEHALCGGTLTGFTGQLKSPDEYGAYYCRWNYNGDTSAYQESNIKSYQSVFITGVVNSNLSLSRSSCRHAFWKLSVEYPRETHYFCNDEVYYRIPSKNVKYILEKKHRGLINIDLQWRLQPCGGVVNVGDNFLNILNIPQSYNDSLDCAWVLSRDVYEKIEIKLEGNFQLNCDDEFIKIGRISYTSDRHYVFNYCKDNMQNSPDVLSITNVIIEYHSKVPTSNGIKIFIKSAKGQCGGSITYPREFSSPNFPKGYDSNMECEWEIQPQELGFRVSVQFINRFAIEKTPNCTKDAVIIYDWKDNNYIEIARLCGRELPPVFNSTNDKLKIVMRTDNETNLDGFQAVWTQICGGTYYATDSEQYLYSPGYPHYWSSKTCVYKIKALERKIELKFMDFHIGSAPGPCEDDNLTISSTANQIYHFKIFCGNEIPKINTMFSEVEIIFNSIGYDSQNRFKLAYSLFSCGGHITHPTTIVSGPHEDYHNNLNCTCLIEAPKNKIVVLKVIYFHLEKSYGCMNDYLTVYEGSSTDVEKRLALLCGDITSSMAIRSKGNTMTVQFISDAYLQSKGFKFDVTFTYSESVGCGGHINITSSSYTLTSPHINRQNSYENFLDCHWTILAPVDYIIKLSFSLFDIAPCRANYTNVEDSLCDCDFVEIKDGISPDSLVIGTYCGKTSPPEIVSSGNILGIRLSTDGEITGSGFTATLIIQESVCGPSLFNMAYGIVQHIKSPGYDTASIPRGIHCVYHFTALNSYEVIHIHFNDFDLLSGTMNEICDNDKIFITSTSHPPGVSLGKDYIKGQSGKSSLISSVFMYYSTLSNASTPEQYVICGSKKSVDIYVTGSFDMNIITSPQEVSRRYKGVDVEASIVGFCGRNFTELYGRVMNGYDFTSNKTMDDCYTLISVPDNYTISIYFNTQSSIYPNSGPYLDIYDGNTTTSPKLLSIGKTGLDYVTNPIFSASKYVLLHNHINKIQNGMVLYDFTYIATDKGRGCGGYFYGNEGTVTSPLYPVVYRFAKTCEWELETPHGTRVSLHFETFDLGSDCDHNYVQLVDRTGAVLSNYCSETPATYTSEDNYVKIVFVTNRNNGGTGWDAKFFSVL